MASPIYDLEAVVLDSTGDMVAGSLAAVAQGLLSSLPLGANHAAVQSLDLSGGDGGRVDAGEFSSWPGFADRMKREQHEHIYPVSAGEGAAGDPVTVNNSTTDGAGGVRQDQNYWGDVVVLVAPEVFTDSWMGRKRSGSHRRRWCSVPGRRPCVDHRYGSSCRGDPGSGQRGRECGHSRSRDDRRR